MPQIQKKVCVLDVSITRKGAKNILKLRSDVLHKALAGNGKANQSAAAFGVNGAAKGAVEVMAFRFPSSMSQALGGATDVLPNEDRSASASACFKGMSDYGLFYDSTGANMSPLLMVGLEEGVELTFDGIITEELANRWINVAKNWSTKVYNTFLRDWVVSLAVVATVIEDPELIAPTALEGSTTTPIL